MKKNVLFAISSLICLNLVACLSIESFIPQVKTIDSQGNPIPTIGKSLKVAKTTDEIDNIYIETPASIDSSKVTILPSNDQSMYIQADVLANSENDFTRFLAQSQFNVQGRTIYSKISTGNYFCLYSKTVSTYPRMTEQTTQVNGACLEKIVISLPTNKKIKIFVNTKEIVYR